MLAEVNISGYRELRAELRHADKVLGDAFRLRMKDAGEVIARKVRSQVPAKSGRARSTVRVTAGGNTVHLRAGGGRAPYYGWLEFGGSIGGRRPRSAQALWWPGASHPSAHTGAAKRPKVAQGRYMLPTVKRNRAELIDAAQRAWNDARHLSHL